MKLSGLETLEERRAAAFKKFTEKTVNRDQFSSWFPRKNTHAYGLRSQNIYDEEYAHTERLYKSPLFSMRRLLNAS